MVRLLLLVLLVGCTCATSSIPLGFVSVDSPSVETELVRAGVVGRICRVLPLTPYKGWLDQKFTVKAALDRVSEANALRDVRFEVLEAPFHTCLSARGDAGRMS